jgi:hypothetical protein
MEVKNSVIMSPNFIPAVEKLLKVEMSVKDCIDLAEAVDVINGKLKSLEKAKKGIMDRFAKKDENGELVTQPSITDPNLRTPIFESEAAAKGFAEEIQKMLDEVTDIPLKAKIKVKSDINMTTDDFMVIKELIEVI